MECCPGLVTLEPPWPLSRGELGQGPEEVVWVEKLMQLQTSVFQTLGALGAVLQMSQRGWSGPAGFP